MELPGQPAIPGKPSPPGVFSKYPPVGFHFDVRVLDRAAAVAAGIAALQVTSDVDGSFQEVSGISVEIPTEELYEGGENRFAYKLPKPIKYPPLILKRGLISSLSPLTNWVQEILESGFGQPIVTKDLLISLLNEEGFPLMGWLFVSAYPVKWQVSDLNAMENKVVIESLELAYQRYETMQI